MMAIKKLPLPALAFLAILAVSHPAAALKIRLEPSPVGRGAAALVLIEGASPASLPTGTFDDKPVLFFPHSAGLAGVFGADVRLSPGDHPLRMEWVERGGNKQRAGVTVRVVDQDFGTRRLTVKQSQVDLSPEVVERAERERQLVAAALATRSPARLWLAPFLRPVDGQVISAFGRETVINGQPRELPHRGVDLKAGVGTPVIAPAAGRVILTGDHFFAGRSIYLDHGQGLITMYFHLSAIRVEDGSMVRPGQVIGLAGASGRVTGPHLHYGLYLNSARIDPLSFQALTERLARETGGEHAKKTDQIGKK